MSHLQNSACAEEDRDVGGEKRSDSPCGKTLLDEESGTMLVVLLMRAGTAANRARVSSHKLGIETQKWSPAKRFRHAQDSIPSPTFRGAPHRFSDLFSLMGRSNVVGIY